MKESDLESRCCCIARRFGWISYKGNSRSGGADKIFLRGGIGFVVEFKIDGNRQQSNQENEELILTESGIPYEVVYSLPEFIEVLKKFNKLRIKIDTSQE